MVLAWRMLRALAWLMVQAPPTAQARPGMRECPMRQACPRGVGATNEADRADTPGPGWNPARF